MPFSVSGGDVEYLYDCLEDRFYCDPYNKPAQF